MQALVVRRPKIHGPDRIVAAARERGLLVTRAGSDAVRFLPPLNCTPAEIREALGVMEDAAREIEREKTRGRRTAWAGRAGSVARDGGRG
jgi:acetylornithine/succinyldiaminopimelate/putrescine aminotransferase